MAGVDAVSVGALTHSVTRGGHLARALHGMSAETTDVLVLGTGVAGCAAALAAARDGASVTLVTRADEARESNTFYAQGGIVARPPGDTPERLAADIERAGDGLCSPEAVALIAREGPDLVQSLLVEELGVPFDRDGAGFHWTLEGAHSVPARPPRQGRDRRADRARADRGVPQGEEHPLAARDDGGRPADALARLDRRRPTATVRPPSSARTCSRAAATRSTPQLARETILATGGLGQVYLHTTNPSGARGDGFAMARRAGRAPAEPRVRPVPSDRARARRRGGCC